MAELITPAGLAICAAVHLSCHTPFDFAKTIPVSTYDVASDKMQQQQWRSEVPTAFRYDYLAKCLDETLDGNAQCGFYDQCIAVAIYIDAEARVGSYRLCRRADKTS